MKPAQRRKTDCGAAMELRSLSWCAADPGTMSEHRSDSASADLARAYLRHYAAGNPAGGDWTSWDAINTLVREAPGDAWPVILQLVYHSQDDQTLAYVAAGPVEDLLVHHGADVIGLFEEECRSNPRFRQCLSGVWTSRIARAVQERLIDILESTGKTSRRRAPHPEPRKARPSSRRRSSRKRAR
jgi:Family of unknown function (DUF6869)